MIIRKKKSTNQTSETSKTVKKPKSRVIKKQDILPNEQNEQQNVQIASENETKIDETQDFEKIDISSIEFKERVERRRGDRRRGYRRIDERSLVSRAQQEAHSIKELAVREGYQSGINKAKDEIEKLKEDLNTFLNSKKEMYDEFYPHILELALAIAKKIIRKEVELSNDILKDIILETLEQLNSDTQKVEIKVNSEDVEFAKASLPEIIEAKGNSAKMIVTADDSIDKGSCVLIANNGVIDANFKTQLNVLQTAFGIYQGGL